jgi:hypothetical protein
MRLDKNVSEDMSLLNQQIKPDVKNFINIVSWVNLITLCFGICLNSFGVWFKLRRKIYHTSTDIILISLSVCAVIVLLVKILNDALFNIFIINDHKNWILAIESLYPYFYSICMNFHVTFIFLTVSISLNQFVFVYYSIGFIRKNTSKTEANKKEMLRALYIIIFVFTISTIYTIPFWFELKYQRGSNLFITDFGNSFFFKQIFQWSFLVVVGFIPILVIIASNMYLIVKMNRSNTRKKTLNNRSIEVRFIVKRYSCTNVKSNEIEIVRRSQKNYIERNARKSKTIYISVFFYLMFQCPYFIAKFIQVNSFNDFNYYKNIYPVEISNLLLSLNLTFNFSIFYLKHQ